MGSISTDRLSGLGAGLAIKAPCKAVSTAALTLSGEQTVGGVACVEGDRVLLAIANGSVNNGIWVCSTGSWTRAKDFDGNRDVVGGTMIVVKSSSSPSVFYEVITLGSITIGTTSIEIEISQIGAVNAVGHQAFTATAGQQTFTLTNFSYAVGVNSLWVTVDGFEVAVTEVSSTSFSMPDPLLVGQEVHAWGGRYLTTGISAANVSHQSSRTGTIARTQQERNDDSIHSLDFFTPGEADSTTGIQAFWDEVTTSGGVAFLYPGDYNVTELVTITAGTKGFHVIGGGVESVRFMVPATFAAATPAFKMVGSNGQPSMSMSGFSIRGVSAGTGACTVGFQIGSDSALDPIMASYQTSLIKEVFVADFPTCWKIIHARLFRLEGCSAWNNNYTAANTCLLIEQDGLFTGDLVFDACQFVTSKATSNVGIKVTSDGTAYSAVTGYGAIAGVKFRDTVVYAGNKAISLYAGGGSWLIDLWIEAGCQVDQEVDYGLYAESNDSASCMMDIHVDSLYLNKSLLGGVVFTSTGTGGAIRDVWVDKCRIDRAENSAILVFGTSTSGIHITNNTIVDCNENAGAISVNGTQGVVVTGNRSRQDAYNQVPQYLVDFLSGTSEITCQGNDGYGTTGIATIRDQSGDVPKIIDGNLGYNPAAEAALTVGASPYNYKNTTGAPAYVYIAGGTVSGVTLNGRAVPTTSGIYHLVPQGVTLSVSYSSAPTMYTLGVN